MESNFEGRDTSIQVLRTKTRALISDLLNPRMFISAPNGVLRNWQGLASLCKITSNYEASLNQDPDPTNKVLNLWMDKDPQSSTIKQFLSFLEEMDRFDVIDDTIELIDEDIRINQTNPQVPQIKRNLLEADRYIITTDDAKRISEGRPLENYDAFLLYDQDDIDFASQVLQMMENEYNMRFCVKDRDFVGGGLEMDKTVTFITERCNRVIVILSDAFFNSSFNDYYLKFAQAFGIERERKIIPIIYKDTVLPDHMKFIFCLNYKRTALFNFWDRLRDSVRVCDSEKVRVTRSKSENGQAIRSAIHESNSCRLKPLNHSVKFSSSVGDLNNVDAICEKPLNPSASADNLESDLQHKKPKKGSFLKKIKNFTHIKKDRNKDYAKEDREKKSGRKQMRAVAN